MAFIHRNRSACLLCVSLSVLVPFAASAQAQTPPTATATASPQSAKPLEFEVATIKPIDTKAQFHMRGISISPSGTVRISTFSLNELICVAYNLDGWQVQGGEPWMEKDMYDVVGESPESVRQASPNQRRTPTRIADPRLREELQSLLTERFQLKVHRTTQSGKVYLLKRTSKPLALKPMEDVPAGTPQSPYPSGDIGYAGGRWVLHDTTLAELASFAQRMMHRPVFDRTGVAGVFNYRSGPFDQEAPFPADLNGPFLDLLAQIGLKLTPAPGKAEFLVIDHAEHPSEN